MTEPERPSTSTAPGTPAPGTPAPGQRPAGLGSAPVRTGGGTVHPGPAGGTAPPRRRDEHDLRPGLGLFRFDRAQRRRERMIEEIQRNRRGEYTVPTWVLALALVLVVAGWAALVVLA